jgi:hypothetical protein
MGNHLFMAATCIAYSIEHNLRCSMPVRTNDNYWNPIHYFPHLEHPEYQQGREDVLVNQPFFHYSPIPFQEEWRGKYIILNGYYQSGKFFNKYRDEIISLFNLHYQLKPVISIHSRYGDYLRLQQKHILINDDYLKEAMKIATEKTGISDFKVFSDDIAEFKRRHGHLWDFQYSTNTNEKDDIVEISCCHSNIGSSSTFSWWGAWLNRNPDKVVITQSQWFQPGWDGLNTEDVLEPEWIKLPL